MAVQRQPGLEPQRVAGAEPGRRDAGADDRRPTATAAGVGGHRDLDAVLARVAGAGDRARRRRPTSHSADPEATDGRRLGRDCAPAAAGPSGPARRARPASAVIVVAADRRSTHAVGVGGVRHHVEHGSPVVVRVPPHDDVVEHRARRRRRAGGCTAPARARSCRGRW